MFIINGDTYKDAGEANCDAKSETNRSDTSDARKTSGIPLRKTTNSRTTNPSSPKVAAKKGTSSPPSQSASSFSVRLGTTAKQSLEIQFTTKKKRFDMLKKELVGKQKPILELYQGLLELKRKLEQNGTHPHLDELKFIDCRLKEEGSEGKVDLQALEALRSVVQQLGAPLVNYCTHIIDKRANILQTIETNPDSLRDTLPTLQSENAELERSLGELRKQQEKNVADIVDCFRKVMEGSNVTLELPRAIDVEEVEDLKAQLREKESKLYEVSKLLQEAREEAHKRSATAEELHRSKHYTVELKQKIKVRARVVGGRFGSVGEADHIN